MGRRRAVRRRRRATRVPQLLQDAGGADDAGELRRPQLLAGSGPRPRHPRPGLVPGRRVGGRLHRHGEPGRDRLLRPGTDRRAEPGRAQPRRSVVDVLVQRSDLWHRDRPRPRHVRAAHQRHDVGERDRRRVGGAGRRSSTPSIRQRIVWAPSFNVAGSYFDQAVRGRAARSEDGEQGRQAPREGRDARWQGRDRVSDRPAQQRHPGPRTRHRCGRR